MDDDPKVPKIVGRDGDRRIIRWAQIFLDSLDAIIGAKGPLRYVLRDDPVVPPERDDPLYKMLIMVLEEDSLMSL